MCTSVKVDELDFEFIKKCILIMFLSMFDFALKKYNLNDILVTFK